MILLDLGDGDIVLLTIEATDGSAFDEFVGEAMPIVDSLRFKR